MHWAAKNGSFSVLKLLLDDLDEVNLTDKILFKEMLFWTNQFDEVPFLLACQNHHREVVSLLKDRMGFARQGLPERLVSRATYSTPLHYAIEFIANAAPQNSKSKSSKAPASKSDNDDKLLHDLLDCSNLRQRNKVSYCRKSCHVQVFPRFFLDTVVVLA